MLAFLADGTSRQTRSLRSCALALLFVAMQVSIAHATPFAYVRGNGSTIHVVDVATSSLVGTISVTPPAGFSSFLALSPSGQRLYTGGTEDGQWRLRVIDATTNTVLTNLAIEEPRGMAVNALGTRLYVASADDHVYVVNTSTNTVITSIPVAGPWGVVVSPDGSRVYTSNFFSNSATAIDTASNTVVGTLPLPGGGPKGLAISPSGATLYVTRPNLNGVAVIDTATFTVTTTVTGIGNDPTRIAVNPAGTRAYAACENGNLFVIDTATNTVIANVPVSVNGGIGVTPDGTKLYALKGNAPPDIKVLDATTYAVLTTITGVTGATAEGLFIGPICPGSCSDGNPCTVDGCNSVSGCTYTNSSSGAPCDDGTFCNGADTCDGAGGCSNHPGDPCIGGPECADTCNEVVDTCNELGGTPCATDGEVCTDDECDGFGLCVHDPNSDPCDDLLYCNGTDTCAAGSCSLHTGDPCDGNPECADTCIEATDSCNTPAGVGCTEDGSVCSDDECDGTGACTHPAANAGLPCRADAGQCDVAESCDGVSPACPADSFEPDGTGCDDGAECTIEDQCTAGTCGGNSMTCGDGIVQSGCNEECDDGGFMNDDGCDDACQFEPCKPSPDPLCKPPFVGGKASIKLKNDANPTKDSLQWKWSNGSHTDKLEFGDPVTTDDYWLCIYDNGALKLTTRVAAGGMCDGNPCWKEKPKGYQFKSKAPGDDGGTGVSLGAGDDGKAKAQFKGKGGNLELPDLGPLTGPIVVQMVKSSGGACWSATYSAPFSKDDGVSLSDRAD